MKQNLFILLLFLGVSLAAQEKKKSFLTPKKIGFMYNFGSNENYIFDDPDYSYTTNTYKLQAFYDIAQWNSFDFQMIVQPQVQFINHQLQNLSYVTLGFPVSQEESDELLKKNNINLYGIEFGFAAKYKLFQKLYLQGTISLGFAYIDTRTERVAKGFTFIENFSLGFSYPIFKNSDLYLGSNFGHVSNLNFQKPNDGYNVIGIEVGYSFYIN